MSDQVNDEKVLFLLNKALMKFKLNQNIEFENSKNAGFYIQEVMTNQKRERQNEILENIIRWSFSLEDIDNIIFYNKLMQSIISGVKHDLTLFLLCTLKYAEGLFFAVNDYDTVIELCMSGCEAIRNSNMKLDIMYSDYLLLLARSYEECNEYEKAKEKFYQVEDIRQNSDYTNDFLNLELYYYYGHFCLEVDELEKAKQLFEKAEDAISEKEDFYLRIDIANALVNIDCEKKEYSSAIERVDMLLKTCNRFGCNEQHYIEILIIKAIVFSYYDNEKAINTYREVVTKQKNCKTISEDKVIETELEIIKLYLSGERYLLAKEYAINIMSLYEKRLKSEPSIWFKVTNLYLHIILCLEDHENATILIKNLNMIDIKVDKIDLAEYYEFQFNCEYYYGLKGDVVRKLSVLKAMEESILFSSKPDYYTLFRCKWKIANTYLNQEEYKKAYDIYFELVNEKKYGDINKVNYAVMLAEFIRSSVKLNKLKGLEEIIKIINHTFKDIETLEYAKALGFYSTYYKAINDSFKLERCIKDEIRIKETIAPMNVVSIGKAKNNLAIYYLKYGIYEDAIKIFIEVKELFYKVYGKNSYEYCRLVANMAIGYFEVGDKLEAQKNTLICNEIIDELRGSYYHLKSQIKMLNIRLFIILGNYTKAREIADRLYIELKTQIKWNLDFQYSVVSKIVELDIIEGYSEDAIKKLNKFKENLNGIDNYYLLALVNHDLANVYHKIGSFNSAVKISCEAVDAALNYKFNSYLSSSGKVSTSMDYKLAPMYNLLLSCYSKLNELEKQKYVSLITKQLFAKKIDELFLHKLKDKLVIRELINISSYGNEYKQVIHELALVNGRQSKNLDEYKSIKLETAMLISKKEMIENKLLQQNFNYKEIYKELKASEIDTSIVVEYHEYINWRSSNINPHYVAVIYNLKDINKSNISFIAECNKVNNLISDMRKLIRKKKKIQKSEIIVELRNLLIEPVSKVIGDIKEISIAPDGGLSFIPFELFYTDTKISYLPNCNSLTWYRKNVDNEFTASVLGDPLVYNPRSKDSVIDMSFELPTGNLKYSELECSSISKILGSKIDNVYLYTRDRFDKKATLKQPSDTILHISSHGYYFKRKEMSSRNKVDKMIIEENDSYERCGIITSQTSLVYDNESLYRDVILSGRDIIESDFSNTKLVTLSACDTGMGDVVWNKSSIGLNRAFLFSGAENVIVSLWKVDDFSTTLLMIRFYELIAEGENVKDALSKSKMYIKNLSYNEIVSMGYKRVDINNETKPFRSEYYWAGFICIGSGDIIFEDKILECQH